MNEPFIITDEWLMKHRKKKDFDNEAIQSVRYSMTA